MRASINKPFLTSDDGKKIVGYKNPDGTDRFGFNPPTFDSMAEFQAASGAAVVGNGPVWIDGQQEIIKNGKIIDENHDNKQRRLWPIRGHNIYIRGSNDWNGECTHLFDVTLKRVEIGNNTSVEQIYNIANFVNVDGSALGELRSVNCVKAVSKGVLLAELVDLTNLTNQRTYVYRSIDNGVSWGNDVNASNNRPVLRVGFDGTNHIAQTYLLRGHCLEPVTINGREAVLAAWYTIPDGSLEFNTNAMHISWDAGRTWTTLWQSNALTRHAHLIKQDPYSGWIYIGFGDSFRASGIIGWDGVSPWPSGNFTYDSLKGRAGFTVWTHTDKRFRPLAFWFSKSHVHWSSDNNGSGATMIERGFYRCPKGADHTNCGALAEQVSTINARYTHTSGGYGIVAPDGAWYSIEFQDASETRLTREVYCSWDQGESWHHVANMEQDANPVVKSDIGVAGKYVWIANDNFAGGNVYSYLFESRVGNIDRVEQIAPCRWVDVNHANKANANTGVEAANNITQGFTPDYPLATILYPLTSNRATHGMRIMVADGLYPENRIDVAYGTNGKPATAGQQLQVTGYHQNNAVHLRVEAGQSAALRMTAGEWNFLIDVSEISTLNNSGQIYIENDSFTGVTEIAGSVINRLKNSTANLLDSTAGKLKLRRSRVYPSGAGIGIKRRSTAQTPEISHSAIIGGTHGVLAENTGTASAIIENSVITGQTGNTLRSTGAADNNHFHVRNSYIARFGAGTGMQHTNALTYNNQIDYSVIHVADVISGFNGVFNANGISYVAGMFPFISADDFGSDSDSLRNFGAEITAPKYDLNLNKYDAPFIGVVKQ